MKRTLYIITASFALTCAPLFALAQTPAGLPGDQGIFNCNQTGAYAMSVGSLNAVGGTFVPVSDNAVTLNTGYLVYKECVLRPVIAAEAHTLSAAKINQDMQTFLGLNASSSPNYRSPGNPYFVQYYGQEQFQAGNSGASAAFPSIINALSSTFQNQVRSAIATNYAMTTQSPQRGLTCPYQGNPGTLGSGSPYSALFAAANPTCDPVYAYYMAQDQVNANYAAAQNSWQNQLNWGRGIYPIVDSTGKIVTPAVLLGAITEQSVTSGLRQIENANDIGQMVNSLFAGMSNRILSSALGGLTTSAPYLAQTQLQEASKLSQSVTNLVASILGPVLNVEQAYNHALTAPPGTQSMAGDLLEAQNRLQNVEARCWALIASSTCASAITYTSAGTATCTATSTGATLQIATTTEFSRPIITQQIDPLSRGIVDLASTSNAFLAQATALIQAYTPATAGDFATRATALVAGYDYGKLSALQDRATRLHAGLFNGATEQPPGLIAQTIQTWVGNTGATDNAGNPVNVGWDGTSTSLGWCNVPVNGAAPSDQQMTTLNNWVARWSH